MPGGIKACRPAPGANCPAAEPRPLAAILTGQSRIVSHQSCRPRDVPSNSTAACHHGREASEISPVIAKSELKFSLDCASARDDKSRGKRQQNEIMRRGEATYGVCGLGSADLVDQPAPAAEGL